MIKLGIHENSPLRYPGGKSQRSTRLLRLADQTRKHYVEPFAGGLGMLFRARRERMFNTYRANDLDANLINFYTILRDYPDELIERLWTYYQLHGAGDEELFHLSREDLASGSELKRAVAFFVINRWAVKGDFNGGMIRTTKTRNGMSPRLLDRLPLYSELLRGVTLTNVDYREVEIPRNTFVFLDPPYENTGETLYSHTVDLTDFGIWAKNLNCLWLITLNDSEFTDSLFGEFARIVEPVKYPAAINPEFGSFKRRNTTEILIMNYHRPTRDAFVRQFGWSVRKARMSSKAG
jgi:DNA adenine methylase